MTLCSKGTTMLDLSMWKKGLKVRRAATVKLSFRMPLKLNCHATLSCVPA